VLEKIDAERAEAEAGRPSRIFCKMNSLVDREVIKALYKASKAGVPIDLIVRGICSLRPGVPDVSENIRVRSVVDRFLEHERILVFGAGERERMFLSSADWMPRNFLRRVELTWPVKNSALRKRIFEEILQASFQDDRKSWSLGADGTYTLIRAAEGKSPLRSQSFLLDTERQAGAALKSRRKRPLLRGAVLLAPERESGSRAKWKPSAATAKKKGVKRG